MLTEVLLKK